MSAYVGLIRCIFVATALAAMLALASCSTFERVFSSEPEGPTAIPPEQIQSELMAFADRYWALVGEAFDQVADQQPAATRSQLHNAKLRAVQGALTIAAEPNPVAGLLDMAVMVSLQRIVVEEYWIESVVDGDSGAPLTRAMRVVEDDVWSIVERAFDEQTVEELRQLVLVIRQRNPEQIAVSSYRASDFAERRTQTTMGMDEGEANLIQLFRLDPLANLSPAARELAQSRLLAERAFFYAKRAPTILNWQTRDVILDAVAMPESQQLLEASVNVSDAGARLATAAEGLSDTLVEEREAAIEQIEGVVHEQREAAIEQLAAATAVEREAAIKQLADATAVEREAAIKQFGATVAAEREAILATFEAEEVKLRGLIDELRTTIEAGTALTESTNQALGSFDEIVEGFRESSRNRPPNPDRRPFDIQDYEATAATATKTVEELNRLLAGVQDLLESPEWDARKGAVAEAAADAQSGLEGLIDRLFWRGMMLVGALLVGAFVVAILYRLVAVRVIRPAGA